MLMAIVTALFNNFGFYMQPEFVDDGSPGYEIVEENIDYKELYSWYVTSMSSEGDRCNLNPDKCTAYANNEGYYWFIANAPYNPDAKAGLMKGDVIVAPQDCKVKSTPGEGVNTIVVENGRRGVKHFKIVVKNPERWFCCLDKDPDSQGKFTHTSVDHRVDLKAGQPIAVAGDKTTIEFYRGDSTGNLVKTKDLRKFYNHTDADIITGNKDDYWNGKKDRDTYAQPDISDDDIFTKNALPNLWKKDDKGWWYGNSGTPGVDWVQSKWIIYESEYYYFDETGYMVTDWYNDRYFRPKADGIFKEGTLAYNTIVPFGNVYLYVNFEGVVEDGKKGENRTDDSNIYIWDEQAGVYVLSSTPTADSSSLSQDNNKPTSDIPKYETLSNQEYEDACDGASNKSDGWYLYNNYFCYIQDSSMLGVNEDGEYEWEDYMIYPVGNEYYFISDKGFCYMPGDNIVSNGTEKFYIRDSGAVLVNGWRDLGNSNWIYADDFTLLCDGLVEIDGDMYFFKSNGVLDNKTPVVDDDWILLSEESGKRYKN